MGERIVKPLKWYGGKTRLAAKLLPLIPDHKTYVEAFAGSAALFFAKGVSDLEIINDVHSEVVNLYQVLRDEKKFTRFQRLASLTPYSREEFLQCRHTVGSTPDEVERARRFFVMIRQSHAALGRSFGCEKENGRNGKASAVSGYLSAIECLPEIHERIKGAQVEHLDFRQLIHKYDAPQTFFYLDPPYVMSTRKDQAYKHEMRDEDHEDLINILLKIEGKAMLSGYDNEIYQRLDREGWTRHVFNASCSTSAKFYGKGKTTSASSARSMKRDEIVWVKQ